MPQGRRAGRPPIDKPDRKHSELIKIRRIENSLLPCLCGVRRISAELPVARIALSFLLIPEFRDRNYTSTARDRGTLNIFLCMPGDLWQVVFYTRCERAMFGLQKWRRRWLANRTFPQDWQTIVQRNVSYYHFLPADQQHQLRRLIQVFMAEKKFEGCGGLQLGDEVMITIAAQGCILLLGLERDDIYPMLRSILVYPSAYVAKVRQRQPDGTVAEGRQGRSGESWADGYVVLSWNDIQRDAGSGHDGRNVVYHEFAHQLDSESGTTEGAPILPDSSMYSDWARVLGAEYEALCANVERDVPTLLDPYGAVSPAEFFAVATECFFELPADLKKFHPDLYEQLRLFYRQDPAALMIRQA
jgi:MtfA peptidase